MFQYALLMAVAAAASYTKDGPSNEKAGATDADAATVMQTTQFTEAISKTTNDTKVVTTSTLSATSPSSAYGTDIKTSSTGICYKTGDGITVTDGTPSGTNMYTCTITTMNFGQSGAGGGTFERYGTDKLPWETDQSDNNKTKDCKQEFTWETADDTTTVSITDRE